MLEVRQSSRKPTGVSFHSRDRVQERWHCFRQALKPSFLATEGTDGNLGYFQKVSSPGFLPGMPASTLAHRFPYLQGQRGGTSAAHPSRTAWCSYSQLCSPAQICRDCARAEEPRGCAQKALFTSQLLLPLMRRALIQYVNVKPQNIFLFCFVSRACY